MAARNRLGTLNADEIGASAYHRVQRAPKFGAAYVAGTLAFCLMAQAMIIAAHHAPPASAVLDCGGGPGWRATYGLVGSRYRNSCGDGKWGDRGVRSIPTQ